MKPEIYFIESEEPIYVIFYQTSLIAIAQTKEIANKYTQHITFETSNPDPEHPNFYAIVMLDPHGHAMDVGGANTEADIASTITFMRNNVTIEEMPVYVL